MGAFLSLGFDCPSTFFIREAKKISIQLGKQSFKIGNTKANGHFQGRVRISAAEGKRLQLEAAQAQTSIRFQSELRNEAGRKAGGEVHFLEATGVSVISDIDDTIKISRINDRKELLRKTFVEPFAPVPGMALAFQSWATNVGARFHYVSASPWQLYQPLAEFVASNGFPAGTFHLKHFRWKDEDLFSLFSSPNSYKPAVIEPLLKRFPQRRFVLVGDSGEQDPEIYAALARKYPKQIARILIRDTTGDGTERYATAFQDLPKSLWQVFQDSATIRGLVP
jgi:phosphatidate phosphatase APP1